MSFSIEYKLSKDSYPELTICPEGTVLDHGINGISYFKPRDIDVLIKTEESGYDEAIMVSVNDLVEAYLELHTGCE